MPPKGKPKAEVAENLESLSISNKEDKPADICVSELPLDSYLDFYIMPTNGAFHDLKMDEGDKTHNSMVAMILSFFNTSLNSFKENGSKVPFDKYHELMTFSSYRVEVKEVEAPLDPNNPERRGKKEKEIESPYFIVNQADPDHHGPVFGEKVLILAETIFKKIPGDNLQISVAYSASNQAFIKLTIAVRDSRFNLPRCFQQTVKENKESIITGQVLGNKYQESERRQKIKTMSSGSGMIGGSGNPLERMGSSEGGIGGSRGRSDNERMTSKIGSESNSHKNKMSNVLGFVTTMVSYVLSLGVKLSSLFNEQQLEAMKNKLLADVIRYEIALEKINKQQTFAKKLIPDPNHDRVLSYYDVSELLNNPALFKELVKMHRPAKYKEGEPGYANEDHKFVSSYNLNPLFSKIYRPMVVKSCYLINPISFLRTTPPHIKIMEKNKTQNPIMKDIEMLYYDNPFKNTETINGIDVSNMFFKGIPASKYNNFEIFVESIKHEIQHMQRERLRDPISSAPLTKGVIEKLRNMFKQPGFTKSESLEECIRLLSDPDVQPLKFTHPIFKDLDMVGQFLGELSNSFGHILSISGPMYLSSHIFISCCSQFFSLLHGPYTGVLMNTMMVSEPGAGKNVAADAALGCTPRKHHIPISDFSTQALKYLDDIDLSTILMPEVNASLVNPPEGEGSVKVNQLKTALTEKAISTVTIEDDIDGKRKVATQKFSLFRLVFIILTNIIPKTNALSDRFKIFYCSIIHFFANASLVDSSSKLQRNGVNADNANMVSDRLRMIVAMSNLYNAMVIEGNVNTQPDYNILELVLKALHPFVPIPRTPRTNGSLYVYYSTIQMCSGIAHLYSHCSPLNKVPSYDEKTGNFKRECMNWSSNQLFMLSRYTFPCVSAAVAAIFGSDSESFFFIANIAQCFATLVNFNVAELRKYVDYYDHMMCIFESSRRSLKEIIEDETSDISVVQKCKVGTYNIPLVLTEHDEECLIDNHKFLYSPCVKYRLSSMIKKKVNSGGLNSLEISLVDINIIKGECDSLSREIHAIIGGISGFSDKIPLMDSRVHDIKTKWKRVQENRNILKGFFQTQLESDSRDSRERMLFDPLMNEISEIFDQLRIDPGITREGLKALMIEVKEAMIDIGKLSTRLGIMAKRIKERIFVKLGTMKYDVNGSLMEPEKASGDGKTQKNPKENQRTTRFEGYNVKVEYPTKIELDNETVIPKELPAEILPFRFLKLKTKSGDDLFDPNYVIMESKMSPKKFIPFLVQKVLSKGNDVPEQVAHFMRIVSKLFINCRIRVKMLPPITKERVTPLEFGKIFHPENHSLKHDPVFMKILKIITPKKDGHSHGEGDDGIDAQEEKNGGGGGDDEDFGAGSSREKRGNLNDPAPSSSRKRRFGTNGQDAVPDGGAGVDEDEDEDNRPRIYAINTHMLFCSSVVDYIQMLVSEICPSDTPKLTTLVPVPHPMDIGLWIKVHLTPGKSGKKVANPLHYSNDYMKAFSDLRYNEQSSKDYFGDEDGGREVGSIHEDIMSKNGFYPCMISEESVNAEIQQKVKDIEDSGTPGVVDYHKILSECRRAFYTKSEDFDNNAYNRLMAEFIKNEQGEHNATQS